jgi:hypothetical protein
MHGRPLYELKDVLCRNDRLPFNDFEDLLFHPYITYSIWTDSVPSHSVKYFCPSEFVVIRKGITIW